MKPWYWKHSNWPIHSSRHDESVFAQFLSGIVKHVSVVSFRVLPPGDQPPLAQGKDYLQYVRFSCITLPAVYTIGKCLRRTTRSYEEVTRNWYTAKAVMSRVHTAKVLQQAYCDGRKPQIIYCQEERQAEVGKLIRFVCGKSLWFHCSACLALVAKLSAICCNSM